MASTDSDDHDKIELEKAFSLLKKGNEEEDKKLFWDAARSFDEARQILTSLQNYVLNSSSIPDGGDHVDNERQQIATLYRQQADIYFHRARRCFIKAITEEDNADQEHHAESKNDESKTTTVEQILQQQKLSDDECMERLSLFGRLFAKDLVDIPIQQFINNNHAPIEEQEATLEGRLRLLNKSLPPVLKSEEERMNDINNKMNRLGLSTVYTEPRKSFGGVFSIDPPKSETEQVADIIAQAKDLVSIEKAHPDLGESSIGLPTNVQTKKKKIIPSPTDESDEEDETDIESSVDDENDDDKEFTPEDCKEIQEKLAEALAALAELNAMFDVDEAGDAAIQFDQGTGRHVLKRARIILSKVGKKWDEC